MAFNSNGQISYLVLDSLAHGSKYGLEIIEFISHKTGGNYIMKKPTLYSCLTRMEKKGYVSSSYWGESEFGGKRHYYTITTEGKRQLEELSKEFENMSFDEKASPVATVVGTETTTFSNDTTRASDFLANNANQDSENSNIENTSKPVFLQQDSIFNVVKTEEKPVPQKQEEPQSDSDVVDNQIDFFSYSAQQPAQQTTTQITEITESDGQNAPNLITTDEETITQSSPSVLNENTDVNSEKMQYYQTILETNTYPESEKTETVKDDAKLLDEDEKLALTPFQEEQNRRIYDTSSELKKYRKKKSFSENQIEMSVVYEKEEDREIQKNRIEQLKASMLQARQNGYSTIGKTIPTDTSNSSTVTSSSQSNTDDEKELIYKKEDVAEDTLAEDKKDDAIFITGPRMEESQIPIQKRITPPNIEVNIYDDDLPAPKRDSKLEPTYKDMMAKLFERKKEKEKAIYVPPEEPEQVANVDSFTDYNTLKKYYAGHGIEFKEYHKTSIERNHNTNLLTMIGSTILLLLAGVGCGILFGILSACGVTRTGTNFWFYTVPAIFLIYTIVLLVIYKAMPSKKASLTYNGVVNWAIFIIASLFVLIGNLIAGMQAERVELYLTSLLVPIYGLLLAFPINYYIKKILFKKFAK